MWKIFKFIKQKYYKCFKNRLFIEKMQQESKSNDYLNSLKQENKYQMIKEALNPRDYNLIVTPKEIDDLIENMSSVIARGINYSL